jgi:5-methylcytosine-specific restriction enzyme A
MPTAKTFAMPTRPPVFNPASGHRSSASERGYNWTWHKLAAAYRRQHPLCCGCLAVGRTKLAECTDHVIPHKGDPDLMWSQNNLQPLCNWHHDVIKPRLELAYFQGKATIADLHMNSQQAIELTKRFDPLI